jgi:hypothetical protein
VRAGGRRNGGCWLMSWSASVIKLDTGHGERMGLLKDIVGSGVGLRLSSNLDQGYGRRYAMSG